MEAWRTYGRGPTCANPLGERQHPDIRQRTSSSRRCCTVFEGNRSRSGHKRDRVEVSGQAGLEFLLAAHGLRATAAEREYVDHRVVFRALRYSAAEVARARGAG